jgi:hypothetical protein
MASKAIGSIGLLALLLATTARAEPPAAYQRLREQAESLDSLSSFLERYVGRCPPSDEQRECKAKAQRERAALTGKTFHVRLGDEAARLLQAGAFDESTRQMQINLTPFFDGGGIALTDRKPLGLDGQGRPRIGLITLVTTLPPDMLPMDMERQLRTLNVRIDLVFKPQGVWSLPGKQPMEGVKAKLLAVRLTNARTGEEIALALP